MWLSRSWLEFMRSTHTLWNMAVYDGDAVCEVLPASEGQVPFQDLPTMEGAWKQVVSSHKNCIPISCSRYLVGDSGATQDRSRLRLRIEVLRAPNPQTTHIVQVVWLSSIYT